MDEKKFREKFLEKREKQDRHISPITYNMMHKQHIAFLKKKKEDELLMIPVEEMAELTQHLSKIMQKKEPLKNNLPLLEEMADVQICLDNLKHYCEISDDDFAYAVDIKMERNAERIKKTEKDLK